MFEMYLNTTESNSMCLIRLAIRMMKIVISNIKIGSSWDAEFKEVNVKITTTYIEGVVRNLVVYLKDSKESILPLKSLLLSS